RLPARPSGRAADHAARSGKELSANLVAAPFELIGLFRKEHVEAGQRAIASADIALELDLHVGRHVRRVDLLLERPQAVLTITIL
ncbi:MAG TPA: hypothetical protein VNJ04_17885, partial [Gemmatimonadaceae bacterium]|nr:hypothetical protein [Gemmatimonadaceae bacterium]